ncbi:MAG: hypothetical protein J2P45_18880 [Candidatus Dormibacteraeota bacterium]|nr:hypothetical protein [Candidatus Dormibacteraeota bacterium]
MEASLVRRPVRRRLEDSRRRAATTPGRLRLLAVSIAVTAISLMLIGSGALVAALITVNDMQGQTMPAIVGMERVHALLSDADRSAAQAYLLGANNTTNSQLVFDAESAATNLDVLGRLNPDAVQLRYQADIAAASHELQRSTTLGVGGDQVNQRLVSIASSVANYTTLIQTAMQSLPDFVGGTIYLEAASNLMHGPGGILAQITSAEGLYTAGMDRDNLALRVTVGVLGVYAVVAIVLLVLLLRTQRFVSTRFRRRRNPRLLLATMLLLVVAAGSGVGALQAAASVRFAEQSSNARLLALWTARSLAYDADGQAAMLLVSRNNAHNQAFEADSNHLVDRQLTDQLVQHAADGQVQFNGLLADQVRSAGTPGQREAAMNALRAYQQYQEASATARAAIMAGGPRVVQPGEINAVQVAFDKVDWNFSVSIQSLQSQSDTTMARAQLALTLTAILEVLTLGVAALTFWGVQPRIREYTVGESRLSAA